MKFSAILMMIMSANAYGYGEYDVNGGCLNYNVLEVNPYHPT